MVGEVMDWGLMSVRGSVGGAVEAGGKVSTVPGKKVVGRGGKSFYQWGLLWSC